MVGVGVVAVGFVAATTLPSGRSDAHSLADRVREFVSALREDYSYLPPDEQERRRLAGALMDLAEGADELQALGMVVEKGVDGPTGRPYALVTEKPGDERGRGLYVVDLSQQTRIAVQVPHPVNDLRTDEIGVELFRRMPGAVLAVSGTNRRAADVAHRTDSVFHALAEEQTRRRLPQVQLHGFDDRSLPTADVVLSPGPGRAGEPIERVAEGLADLRVCLAWQRACGALEGTKNAQGAVAAEHSTTFVHVEMNRTVRESRTRWASLVDGIAKIARN